MRRLTESKYVRGGAEGGALVSLSYLVTDGIITFVPWFELRRVHLLTVVSVCLGALLRKAFSHFVWRSSCGR